MSPEPASAADTTALKPISTKDRIDILDILRGFAILGIFIANLSAFTGFMFLSPEMKVSLFPAGTADEGRFFLDFLVDGKFYSIFSFLFGLGFAIMMIRARQKGKAFLPLYFRRIFWLFIFGAIHSLLIWAGDILAVYAITALLLIPFRNLGNRTIIFTAVLLLLSPILFYLFMMGTGIIIADSMFLFAESLMATTGALPPHQAIISGNFSEFVKFNLIGTVFRYSDLFFTSRFPKILGMFLIGFWFGRNEIFANIQAHYKLFRNILITCGITGLFFSGIMAQMHMDGIDWWPLEMNGLYLTIAYALGVHTLALAYIAGISILYLKYKPKLLLGLAPAGRMALTNYIMHSIIGILVFYNIGMGVAPIGPLLWIPFGIVIFALQVVFSKWWLSKYKFGPLEWVWRSLVYRKRQTFKAAPAVI